MAAETAPTILVVDDNPASRYATSRILRAAGFTILEAGTGFESLHVPTNPIGKSPSVGLTRGSSLSDCCRPPGPRGALVTWRWIIGVPFLQRRSIEKSINAVSQWANG